MVWRVRGLLGVGVGLALHPVGFGLVYAPGDGISGRRRFWSAIMARIWAFIRERIIGRETGFLSRERRMPSRVIRLLWRAELHWRSDGSRRNNDGEKDHHPIWSVATLEESSEPHSFTVAVAGALLFVCGCRPARRRLVQKRLGTVGTLLGGGSGCSCLARFSSMSGAPACAGLPEDFGEGNLETWRGAAWWRTSAGFDGELRDGAQGAVDAGGKSLE